MKYTAYPNYKPSGVEWLRDVPAHWTPQKVKFCFSIQLGKMLQPEALNEHDFEVNYLKVQHVQWNDIRVDDLPTMWVSKSDLEKYSIADGDLLVCEGGDVGRAAIVRQVAGGTIIQNALHRVRSKYENDLGFLKYVLAHAASQGWFEILCNRATIAHFTGEKFGALGVALPPPSEQYAIASFLDAQTAKLDILVARKQELIEKLKEKRGALISQTVTRGLPPEAARAAGLNPRPTLKPSGIEWLGDIPVSWGTPPLYTRYHMELGKMLDESRISGTHLVPYLRNIDVQWDSINTLDLPEMDIRKEEYSRYTLKPGDLLVCEGGEVGRAAIFQSSSPVIGFQKALHRLRPINPAEWPRFMFYVFYWASHLGFFLAEGNPNTIAHLTGENLRRYRFPKPPFLEQRAIADYLDRETAKIDRMIEKVEAAIEKLHEYRTALITAAVTGKIDVRKVASASSALT
ncbi:restriction endonuclease subunit S [bacterium]|nr:MAG: restriction endonuclease subunit S [bacterium]